MNVCSGETIEPVVKVTNTGGAITSISFSSSINGGTPVTYTYNGGISAFGSMDITLPEMYFTPQGSNSLSVAITSVNGGSGTVGSPATANKTILIGDEANTIQATVQVTTDRYGSETTWKIYNSSNVVVASGGPYTDAGASGAYPQPDVNFNLVASECYYVELLDAYGDGFDSGYGNGDFKVMSGTNNVVSMSTFASGGLLDDKFSTSYYLSLDENELANSVNVFPNPANDDLNVKFTSVENYVVSLTDLQGRVISSKSESMNGEATVTFNVVDLAAGSYIVKINTGSNTLVRNVVVK